MNITDVPYTSVTGNRVIEAQQNISLPAPGKTLIVESGASLTLVAGGSITLNPGFEVRPGGTFTTKIEPEYASGNMDIAITSLQDEVYINSNGWLGLSANNANSFDFTAKNSSGSIVYQAADNYHEVSSSNYISLWPPSSVNVPGIYTCTVRLRNNYGRKLEHTWNVTVKNSASKSALSTNTTVVARQKASLPDSAITASDVTVYPNPNSGLVNISITKPFTAYSLKVYSVSGVLVHQNADITSPEHRFDMSRFADGAYLLQMEIDRQPVSKKIILAR